MTSESQVMVDTNVILDVVEGDEVWADWSHDQLNRYVDRLIIGPMIYAELCYEAEDSKAVGSILLLLGLEYVEPEREVLFLAAKAFRTYRKRGGTKTAPLADFFIGAHAAVLEVPVLTRDVSRYRSYFPSVELICPV